MEVIKIWIGKQIKYNDKSYIREMEDIVIYHGVLKSNNILNKQKV